MSEKRPTMRYLLAASPRSGSTLLGRMLHHTGCAGDPLEYFNPVLLEQERRRLGLESLTYREFLKIAQDSTTSSNGVFGMHLHSSQLADAFQTRQINRQIVSFIMGFDKYIWTRRRNRARQAVSWAVARRTQAWSSKDAETTAAADDFTPIELISALKLVCTEDFIWQGLFRDLGIEPKVIWYEDLEGDYQACAAEVIDYLGLSGKHREVATAASSETGDRTQRALARKPAVLPWHTVSGAVPTSFRRAEPLR